MAGSLVVVGTGLSAAAHMTLETKALIEQSEKLLYVVADPVTGEWLESLNPTSESLYSFYDPSVDRLHTYMRMTEYIMSFVRAGKQVCAAFYGHPGVFVFPAHEAIIIAAREGYEAELKPAISAEDCLFADLRIDPGRVGCQSFEATDFLIYNRRFDARSVLILWQIGVLGQIGFQKRFPIQENLEILKKHLTSEYAGNQLAYVYEASPYPVCDPLIEKIVLSELCAEHLTPISTLVIPPSEPSIPDVAMMDRLCIPRRYIQYKQDNPSEYNASSPFISPSVRRREPASGLLVAKFHH